MKLLLPFVVIIFISAQAGAQKNCTVLRSYAFFTVLQPGNIPVDESGKPLKRKTGFERTVYLISSCHTEPVLRYARFHGGKAAVHMERVNGTRVIAGADPEGKNIVLRAPAAGSIWKLSISPVKTDVDHERANIVVYGRWTKNFTVNIEAEKELVALPVY